TGNRCLRCFGCLRKNSLHADASFRRRGAMRGPPITHHLRRGRLVARLRWRTELRLVGPNVTVRAKRERREISMAADAVSLFTERALSNYVGSPLQDELGESCRCQTMPPSARRRSSDADSLEGFCLLGFHVRLYRNRRLYLKPSKAAVKR